MSAKAFVGGFAHGFCNPPADHLLAPQTESRGVGRIREFVAMITVAVHDQDGRGIGNGAQLSFALPQGFVGLLPLGPHLRERECAGHLGDKFARVKELGNIVVGPASSPSTRASSPARAESRMMGTD